MPVTRRTLEFVERVQGLKRKADIEAALYAALERAGFAHVACGAHVDPIATPRGAVSMCSYPLAWQQHYSVMRYCSVDAVFHQARRSGTPFAWEHLLSRSDLTGLQQPWDLLAARLAAVQVRTRGFGGIYIATGRVPARA